MSRWWRAYDEAVDDPKLIALTDEQFRFWFNILCIFSASSGRLPDVSVLKIKLRMQERRVKRLIQELLGAGLLDDDNGLITPHNWETRQYRSDVSTPRVKRFRQRKGNVSSTVSVTPPETDTESETDSEANASAAEPVGEDPRAKLFRRGKTVLASFGVAEKRTGSLLGQWLKARPDPVGLLAAIEYARDQNVAEPVAYISTLVHAKEGRNGRAKTDLATMCFELADEFRNREAARNPERAPDIPGGH